MGMDVYGKNPTSETGSYFRRNVWGWHPLWDYCLDVAPGTAGKVRYGHSNDGDGLDDHDAKELARILRLSIQSGEARVYVEDRDAALAAIPNETCTICHGEGVRRDEVGKQYGYDVRGWCNGCDGKGWVRPFSVNYGLDVDDVKEFADFLVDCGGFEIC